MIILAFIGVRRSSVHRQAQVADDDKDHRDCYDHDNADNHHDQDCNDDDHDKTKMMLNSKVNDSL